MHTLQVLDQIVSRACYFPAGHSYSQCPVTIFNRLDQAVSEAENLRSALLQEAFFRTGKKELKLLVNTYQAVCIHLSNKIFIASPSVKELPFNYLAIRGIIDKQQLVQSHLHAFLGFLQNHYGDFFNDQQSMPIAQAHQFAEQLRTRAQDITLHLQLLNDNELCRQVVAPIHKFIQRQASGVSTYAEYAIIKMFATAVEDDFDVASTDPWFHFLQVCVLVNFCPEDFLNLFMLRTRSAIAMLETASLQKEEWQKLLVRIRQLHAAVGANDDVMVSVQKRFINALKDEINLLECKSVEAANIHQDMPAISVLQTPMSVSQLALFIRLMIDTGTIKCKSHAQLLRTIAATFSTTKSNAISSESLRVKYYSTDPAAINIVKEYVIKMMNQLRSY